MTSALSYPSDVAFTPTVKALQSRHGSRHAYERMELGGGWQTRITRELRAFVEAQDSVFLSTATADGQPYVQHRGGPPGFLHVLDDKTIAFADFAGNRQYITAGNLADNRRAFLFLIDYEQQARIKVWGEGRVVDDDPDLLARLMPDHYKARGERVIVFTVSAWDGNCPQHIPRRVDALEMENALAQRDRRITMLEARLAALSKEKTAPPQ